MNDKENSSQKLRRSRNFHGGIDSLTEEERALFPIKLAACATHREADRLAGFFMALGLTATIKKTAAGHVVVLSLPTLVEAG